MLLITLIQVLLSIEPASSSRCGITVSSLHAGEPWRAKPRPGLRGQVVELLTEHLNGTSFVSFH